MQKQTVAAGLVAGIVAACSGPGMNAIGSVMEDAGEAMSEAGRGARDAGPSSRDGGVSPMSDAGTMLRDAGEMIADAGRELRDAGGVADGGSDASAQAPGDGLPNPRWVLRDKAGDAVEADVYPVYDPARPLFNSQPQTCVSLNYFGQRSIQLSYRLSNGMIDHCGTGLDAATWRDAGFVYFTDAACNGQAYYTGRIGAIKVGAIHYYADGAPSITKAPTYYLWTKATSVCTAFNPAAGLDLWAFKPVPSDVLSLLSKPPYTLELVY